MHLFPGGPDGCASRKRPSRAAVRWEAYSTFAPSCVKLHWYLAQPTACMVVPNEPRSINLQPWRRKGDDFAAGNRNPTSKGLG